MVFCILSQLREAYTTTAFPRATTTHVLQPTFSAVSYTARAAQENAQEAYTTKRRRHLYG